MHSSAPTTRTTGGLISTELRINERIRVSEVRLVGPNGETVGIVPTDQALKLAQEADLDLVEIAPQGPPPVCKLMDYGKFKYENAQKARETRRNQTNTVIKEMKLRPKIDSHDYETKKGHVVRFLKAGDKVKITIMFRGREQSRPELGFNLLKKLADDVVEDGFIESAPKQDGRNMLMVLAPTRKKAEARAEQEAEKVARMASRAANAEAEERELAEHRAATKAQAAPKKMTSAPDIEAARGKTFVATVTTNCGVITIELDGAKAPATVSSFVLLGNSGYWSPSPCHRLTGDAQGLWVLQCGDPTGTGAGPGPGYHYGIENAPADGKYPAGTVAMARTSDPNSNGDQFFIVYKDTTLPVDGGGYSIFGKVTGGMDIVDRIAAAGVSPTDGMSPMAPISILSMTVKAKG